MSEMDDEPIVSDPTSLELVIIASTAALIEALAVHARWCADSKSVTDIAADAIRDVGRDYAKRVTGTVL